MWAQVSFYFCSKTLETSARSSTSASASASATAKARRSSVFSAFSSAPKTLAARPSHRVQLLRELRNPRSLAATLKLFRLQPPVRGMSEISQITRLVLI